MTKIFTSISLIALLAAAPVSAQLLGGGAGGALGGLGSGAAGSIGSTVGRTGGSVTGSATTATRIPRADRAARRAARTGNLPAVDAPSGDAAANGTVLNGRLAGDVAASANSATREVSGSANLVTRTPRADGVLSRTTAAIAAPQVAVPAVALPAVSAGEVNLGYIGGSDVVMLGRGTVLVEGGIDYIPHDHVVTYVDEQYVVLQDELAGTGASVTRRGNQIFIDLPSDVNFAFDRSDIQTRFYPVLNSLARTLNAFPATYVDVIGHTDAVGSDEYNQALSERRASSVADFLVDRSANPDRMFVAGDGEQAPVASNASIQGRAANRRVEIVLTPHEKPA